MRLNAFIQALKPKEIRQSSDDNGTENIQPNAYLYHLALLNVACAENYGSKHLGLTIPKGQAIEDFIYENPKNINVFRS